MMRFGLLGFAAMLAMLAMLVSSAGVQAQSTMLPGQCAGLTGDQLDLCVRNITLPQLVPNIGPGETTPDPAQPINCVGALREDESLCISRNEVILFCRNKNKHPDFEQCASSLLMTQPKPPVANCARVAAAQRKHCELRNKVFGECTSDPLRYFICLTEKMNPKP